ncbi:hypothetical protein ACQP2U_41540 [Nocardia sp. CA-084685]|uniref:hypothetical protein n=1 Tax=Nocardia sp. CA-084685 TaxID=3239970 RepID=UPI003D97D685
MSMLAMTPAALLEDGLNRLRDDLATDTWAARHAELLDKSDLDLGYRPLTAEV